MSTARLELRGIFPPLATPFAADGGVELTALRANVQKYNRSGVAGYVVVGSTGESVYLSEGEKVKIWEAVRGAADAGKILIAGTGCEATAETIALTRRAAGLGYHAVLVRTPSYFRSQMTHAALERHFRAVADASPIPVLIYSVPQFTGLKVEAPLVARLAEHPNILGLKESSGDVQLMAEIRRTTPAEFQVLVGSASVLYPAMCVGAQGAVLAVACALPELCVEVYNAACAGDHARARALQERLLEPTAAVTTRFGIAGLKFAMELRGYVGGAPRPPLLPLDDAARTEIKRIFTSLGGS
ncbi:MAG TPA: dihydrodipicolinate synthase family protein [Candidatus Xenobia bacterium]|nr:dihydrodipicolinate synthase family protein [Candidatus Xenobia bacterium]